MSLTIQTLEVRQFRSYEEFTLELDQELTLIVGPNAVGKTNLVEALQVVTSTESFRKPQWSDLVRWGEEKASVSVSAEGAGRKLVVDLSITREGRREYRVNGKLRRRLMDVAGVIPCVVFTPDDLRLVKDSAERRRAAIDSLGVQLSPSYTQLKADYERTLRQRNALLRDEAPSLALEPWTTQLIEIGSRFAEARTRLFARVREAAAKAHSTVCEQGILEPVYLLSWQRDGVSTEAQDIHAVFTEVIHRRAKEERARKMTLVGPHRDEVVFNLDGRDARSFASQGQQRSIALAWKLGEVTVTTEVGGQPPLLLLDDVMSELDEKRRHALTRLVGKVAQTVVTTTNTGYFDDELLQRARMIELS
ncbi:MAG TPA: DNA replication/repair protein RecF [Coriobacteriia bacterium]|nr:DNA replication/repair protein RecF [Coriobacteriia bacterium]